MNYQVFLTIIITLITVLYLYNFHTRNKKIINKIKYGKILFLTSGFTTILLGVMIMFNNLNISFLLCLIPLLVVSLWFSYEFYKKKNSLIDYIYLLFIIIICLVIFYNLFWD